MALRPVPLEEALENGNAIRIPWSGRIEKAMENGVATEIDWRVRLASVVDNGIATEIPWRNRLAKALENGTAWAVPPNYWAQHRLQSHVSEDLPSLRRQLKELRESVKSDAGLRADLSREKKRQYAGEAAQADLGTHGEKYLICCM